jgi:ATP-dependent DNA ligase I
MNFQSVAELFESLTQTSKRSDKMFLIAQFLKKYATPENAHYLALLIQGKVFEQHENKTIGIASQYVIKALNIATGYTKEELTKMWSQYGDLGEVAYIACQKKKQQTLFSQNLTLNHFLKTIQSLQTIEGNTSVDRKVKLIADILADANALEARYVIRFVLEVMRTGVGDGTIKDAFAFAYFPKIEYMHEYNQELQTYIPITEGFSLAQNLKSTTKESKSKEETELKKTELQQLPNLPQNAKTISINSDWIKTHTDTQTQQIDPQKLIEICKLNYEYIKTDSQITAKILQAGFMLIMQRALDITNSISQVLQLLIKKQFEGLLMCTPQFGKPLKVMLAQKASNISQAAESAKLPCLAEYKYDGFRMQIHKKGTSVIIFTRRLEDVTAQFPEAVFYIQQYVNAEECILDSEAVGYDPQTKKYRPFQYISQRIKRKYDIETLAKELPVEINVFDVIMFESEDTTQLPIEKRVELIKTIIPTIPTKIVPATGITAQSIEELESFYQESLASGNEGIMVKTLGAIYQPGSRVGTMLKVKPIMDTLDLVITKATWGEGKRANWLTSFTVCCIDEDGNLLEVGKVSSGLREIDEKVVQVTEKSNELAHNELTTFSQLTEELKENIISESGKEVVVKPSIVIEVAYEEIQKSSAYSSGYALRFPRIIIVRQARGVDNASTLEQVEGYYYDQHK